MWSLVISCTPFENNPNVLGWGLCLHIAAILLTDARDALLKTGLLKRRAYRLNLQGRQYIRVKEEGSSVVYLDNVFPIHGHPSSMAAI